MFSGIVIRFGLKSGGNNSLLDSRASRSSRISTSLSLSQPPANGEVLSWSARLAVTTPIHGDGAITPQAATKDEVIVLAQDYANAPSLVSPTAVAPDVGC